MPNLIAHDFFGQDVYKRLSNIIGTSTDERDAFLLGCQGPDPLFYGIADPRTSKHGQLGSTMHRELVNEQLVAFHNGVAELREEDQGIGRAYMMGFLCHFMLDSYAHPLVYAMQNAVCSAGVDGLDERYGSEVHSVIECELDEYLLCHRLGVTVADYPPKDKILIGSDHVLDVISALYVYMTMTVFRTLPDNKHYRICVESFRLAQNILFSPTGVLRDIVGTVETMVRGKSLLAALTHSNVLRETSMFANDEHRTWTDPDTGEERSESFMDLFQNAETRAMASIELIAETDFTLKTASIITRDVEFNGRRINQ